MDKPQLVKFINELQISDESKEEFIESIQPFFSLSPKVTDDLPIGASRFGGYPDLPEDVKWPHCESDENRPLSFIASLDLVELSKFDTRGVLPTTGWLLFFYDSLDEGWGANYKVLHINTPKSSLERRRPPSKKVDIFPLCSLSIQSSHQVDPLCIHGSDEFEALGDVYDILTGHNDKSHQVLGYPSWIQEPADGFDESESILLLQVDSDEIPEFIWGDMGMIYFWIHPEDLANQDFENVEAELQCY